MNTKVLAMIIAFTAITVFLNPRFSGIVIPSFVPGLWFQIWEIPVYAAFLILGFRASLSIAILNTIVLQVISPGVPFNVPSANLLAVLATLLGMYLAQKLITRKKPNNQNHFTKREIAFSTTFGLICRFVTMLCYIYLLAVFAGTLQIVVPLFPLIAVYDIIVVLYSVPLAYAITKTVQKYLKLKI